MRVVDIDEKSYKTYENILIFDISYKAFMDAKPLRIWLKKIDGFTKIFDGVIYLVLFGSKQFIIGLHML